VLECGGHEEAAAGKQAERTGPGFWPSREHAEDFGLAGTRGDALEIVAFLVNPPRGPRSGPRSPSAA
jgi:hypothetical protein